MSGQRNVMDSTGETYETLADHLVGRFASTIRVSRQQDYGIDLYCLPRVPTGPRTETAIELGSVQVRGGASELAYGGLNGRGEWKGHEFDWLRGLTVPLYLARVDAACSTVNLFSLWPIWWVFLQAGNPFKIVFTTEPASSEIYTWRSPEALADKDGAGIGDGLRWNVNLGAPFLQLTGRQSGQRSVSRSGERHPADLDQGRSPYTHSLSPRCSSDRLHHPMEYQFGRRLWLFHASVLELGTWCQYPAPVQNACASADQSGGASAVADG
jgi:hypothetical protein